MSRETLRHSQFDSSRPVIIRKLMLTGTFSALYAIFRLIPIDKAIAIPGTIAAGSVIIPVIAIFLDTPYAVAAVVVGTFVGSFAPWNPLRFLGLDFLPGMMNAIAASLMVRGKRVPAILVFVGTIIVFVATPYTVTFVGSQVLSPPIPYYWLHVVALLVLLSPLSKNIGRELESGNYRSVAVALGTVAFVGTMLEHLTGGILSALVFQAGIVHFWEFIYVYYPIERVVLTVLATVVGVPIVMNTGKLRDRFTRTLTRHDEWQRSASEPSRP